MRRVGMLLAAMALVLLLTSGVAWAVNKVGTNGPDTLRGTDRADNLAGRGGNDILLALAGNDQLEGGRGKDIVNGGSLEEPFGGKKNLDGGRGNDAVQGGLGQDNVAGGKGNDFMVDGDFNPRIQQEDKLSGGAGKDVIIVVNRPAFEDLVSCGDGFDRVWADREDLVAPDCERVFFGFASEEEFFESIPESFFEGLHPRFT
jgi:Ca2+-binding RTX toxin-like protein